VRAETSCPSARRTGAHSEQARVTLLCNALCKHILAPFQVNSIKGFFFKELSGSYLHHEPPLIMRLFEPSFQMYWLLVLPPTASLEWRALFRNSAPQIEHQIFLVSDSRIGGHFKRFLCTFLWFHGVFTVEMLRKENTHLHAAKHRQGASSMLLQYLISVRQTSFWKELMFLSIQFWFTAQHFLHSNTLGKMANYFSLLLLSLFLD